MLPWVLLILSGLALLVTHLAWRSRYRAAQENSRLELDRLRQDPGRSQMQLSDDQQTAFNGMAEGVLLLDDAGRIQYSNRALATLFGLTGEIRSRTLLEAIRLHELAELVDSLGSQQPQRGIELRVSRPEGRVIQVSAAALFNAAGRRRGTVLVFHDVSRLKQFERARQEFVANVSHELRTPLSLIKGYVETLLDGAQQDPAALNKFLQVIQRNAERLHFLIEDLLTISELESGRVELNLQTVPLHELVDKVLADMSARAGSRKVQMVNETGTLDACADPRRVEQVLCNLLDNGIKYGKPEGVLRVSARAAGEFVEVSVCDDGPGIPAESLDRIFERFYRVDKARSRQQGGTGLGLAIVKHIVQSHGGKVWVTSEPGHGSQFYFTLPAPKPFRDALEKT